MMGPQYDQRRWMLRTARVVSLALVTTLLVGQSPNAWSQPPAQGEPMRVAQTVPEFEPLTITGVLDESSEVLEDGRFFNSHTFEGVAGQIVVIDLISDEFDTYLFLLDADQLVIATDDNIGNGTNAHLAITLSAANTYQIIVSSSNPGEIGRYTLNLRFGDTSDLASYLYRLGLDYYLRGDHWIGIALNNEAHRLWEHAFGEGHPLNTILDLREQALHQALAGNYAQEEILLQQALDIMKELEGDEHPGVAELLNDLATATFNLGKYDQVEPLLQRALAIYEQANYSEDVATILYNLALFYSSQGIMHKQFST